MGKRHEPREKKPVNQCENCEHWPMADKGLHVINRSQGAVTYRFYECPECGSRTMVAVDHKAISKD